MSIETLSETTVERKKFREVERKFQPIHPQLLEHFRTLSRPVEQFYLSNPNEPFSLRMREELDEDGNPIYTTTLKDRGTLSHNGLDRLEVETEISSDLYQLYKSPNSPCIKKLRTKINEHVSIDYYEDGDIQVESEDPNAWLQFCGHFGECFSDITNDTIANNELRANRGESQKLTTPELNPDDIVAEILSKLDEGDKCIVRICGRSGSGKSTLARQVQQILNNELFIRSDIISSDDYNRGTSWLKAYNNDQDWTEWDHPVVYDTHTMGCDIQKLCDGQIIPRRIFDFMTQEPSTVGNIAPVPVIIIEGIYALSRDLDNLDSLKYEMPTPLATCVGRRIIRDMQERPNFGNPATNLKYLLEQAEPMYRQQLNSLLAE
ncbi:MAG: hypothetical protein ACM3KH_00545 [Thiobacillus sp.]